MSFKISLMIVFAMTLLGCTRATSDKIKVGISLPSVKSENGAQSNQTLQHVIINITGTGMEPYLFTWDAHNAAGSTNQFSFEFDSGTQRLVQALAVYVDTSTEMMSFYYGDANADFTNSSVNISLPIIKLDSGYNASGNISGRYLTSDTGGPTGPVKVTYKPSGKPEMIIERSYIYNGWFNLFGLSDVEFTYSLNDGTVLFGGPTKLLGSSRIPDNSDTVLKLQVPLHRRSKGDGTYEQSEPRVRVYGWFFDSGVSSTVQAGKKICKGTFGSTLPSFIKYSGTTDPLSLLSQTGLEPSSSQFDAVSGTSLVTQGKALYTGGASTGCTSLIEYESKMSLSSDFLDKTSEGAQLIFGPLRMSDANQYTAFSVSSSVYTGQLLPGAESVVNGIKAFAFSSSETANFNSQDEDQIDCTLLTGKSEFVSANLSSSSTTFNLDMAPVSTILSTATSSSPSSLVFCFSNGGNLYPHGKLKRIYPSGGISGGGGGGSGSVGSAPSLVFNINGATEVSGTNFELKKNTCYPASIELRNSSNQLTTQTSDVYVGGLTSAWGSFYSDATCSTALTSAIIPAQQSSVGGSGTLFFKGTTEGNGFVLNNINVPSLNANYVSTSQTWNVFLPQLGVFSSPTVLEDVCYGMTLYRKKPNGHVFSEATNLSINHNGGSNFKIYGNYANCTADSSPLLTNLDIPANGEQIEFYFRKISGASSNNLIFTAADPSYTPGSTTISTGSGELLGHRYVFEYPAGLSVGACNTIIIKHVNSAGVEIPVRNSRSLLLKTVPRDFEFFTSPDCDNTPLDSASFGDGQSRAVVYGLSSGNPSTSLLITGSENDGTNNPSGSLASSGSINLGTPSASSPYLVFSKPLIRSSVLGSHDFPFVMNLTKSTGSTVTCEVSSDHFASVSSCNSFDANNLTFTWNFSDALNENEFRFNVSAASGIMSYYFRPQSDYSRGSTVPFQVLTCNLVLNNTSLTSWSQFQSYFSGGSQTVCLEAGSYSLGTQTQTLNLGNNYLIGATAKSTGIAGSVLAATSQKTMMNLTDSSEIANLILMGATAGTISTTISPLVLAETSSKIINSVNNHFVLTDLHSTAISVSGENIAFTSMKDIFDQTATSISIGNPLTPRRVGVQISSCLTCNSAMVSDPQFLLYSGSGASGIGISLKDVTRLSADPTQNLFIMNAKGDVNNEIKGTLLLADNTATGRSSDVSISNTQVSSSGYEPFIYMKGSVNLVMQNNQIKNTSQAPLILGYANSNGQQWLGIFGSTLATATDYPIISFNLTGQLVASGESNFMRVGTTDVGMTASVISAPDVQTSWTFNKDPLSQMNSTKFCNIDATHQFLDIIPNLAGQQYFNYIGGAPANPVLTTGTVDGVAMKCL